MHISEEFSSEIGSDRWWHQQQVAGIPHIEHTTSDTCQVTFLWRDPQGDERHSPNCRVWINITGITDHHQPAAPQSLERISRTDVWFWQTELPADWRGSYCLIPETEAATATDALLDDMFIRRQWWQERFPAAISDPLNPLRAWTGGRGVATSPLYMPLAPAQPEWLAVDRAEIPDIPLTCLQWQSSRLGNSRRVWVCACGEAAGKQRPLGILLDGQFWVNQMPVAGSLTALTQQGRLPPALYVLPEIIDRQHRIRELPCNPEFWLAVRQELIPLISQHFDWDHQPANTLIAGQSFGGLSAVYATLNWPESFGKALSLSGSFWWPGRDNKPGYLAEQLENHRLAASHQQIYLEAGHFEKMICQANQAVSALLEKQQIAHTLTVFNGGHDALWWRSGLLSGLETLWQSLPGHRYSEH